VGGRILFEDEDLVNKTEQEMMDVRGRRISMIFQDPLTALNPVLTIGEQIFETIITHQKKENLKKQPPFWKHLPLSNPMHRRISLKQAKQRAIDLLELVKIPSAAQRLGEYPHQFSGGMRQRVIIAIALSCDPSILIADEPTTALDVTIQAQILDLLNDIKQKVKMSLIFITHDFGVVKEMCDRIAVMYAGKIVELSRVKTLFDAPKHPYTKALMNCIPDASKRKVQPIPGTVSSLMDLPEGCSFHPRCQHVMDICKKEIPLLKKVNGQTMVRCHLWE